MYANGASNEDQLYRLTVRNWLETAEQHSCTSIVFPAISWGIFGYPPQPAANAFFQEIYLYVREIRPKKIRQIRVAISDASTYQVWKQTYDDAIQALQKVSGS
jgi:O-acetyl-ADP-ribose deacetylase (regulator of RNase III)